MNKEAKKLLALAVRQGFIIEVRRNNHLKVTSPSGRFFFASSTPSDRRAVLNLRADLRRAGFKEEA